MRSYHVVAINDRTGKTEVLSSSPMTHSEAVTFKDKFKPSKHVRIQLKEAGMSANGRTTVADPTAVRELSLYIENDYSLIGAPNSQGAAIHKNLERKVANGTYDSALAPQAWQHLIDAGAKKYEREFGSGSPIFNAATRREVAADFARAWEQENIGVDSADGYSQNPGTVEEPASLARWAMRQSLGATAGFGDLPDGSPRACVIGKKDQGRAGGRQAVLHAIRDLPGYLSEEHGRNGTEFDGGSGSSMWRIVVI